MSRRARMRSVMVSGEREEVSPASSASEMEESVAEECQRGGISREKGQLDWRLGENR